MKANPGGQIQIDAVVGRERLIEVLWETVELQSIVITAERRIGKTTVMKQMRHAPKPGWVPVFQDLESCHSANEFAMAVYKEIHEFLSKKGRFTRRAKEFLSGIGGAEIGGVFKLPERPGTHWKEILTRSIEDLVQENTDGGADTKLLFLWDEMPFMLANIRDREGEPTAMEVLDLLRALRQEHSGLRMIITGSIGLHHVLASLKDKNYANAPFNDMAKIDVEPLDQTDAVTLASRLIQGEALRSNDLAAAARAVAQEADCFPFYVHHIVRTLKVRGLEATAETVAQVVSSQLVDAGDPWELRHFRERIPTYYRDDQKTVLIILDQLASQSDPALVDDLLSVLKGASSFDDRERLLRILSLMERDHYLKRDDDGRHRFRFPLIRRWWKIDRSV